MKVEIITRRDKRTLLRSGVVKLNGHIIVRCAQDDSEGILISSLLTGSVIEEAILKLQAHNGGKP